MQKQLTNSELTKQMLNQKLEEIDNWPDFELRLKYNEVLEEVKQQ